MDSIAGDTFIKLIILVNRRKPNSAIVLPINSSANDELIIEIPEKSMLTFVGASKRCK